jgi:hypothetical protein
VTQAHFDLDWSRVTAMLNRESDPKDRPYTPSVDRREASKLATSAMRQDWRDVHAELARRHPGKGKRWYSVQIARMSVARGRDAETIRKHLR